MIKMARQLRVKYEGAIYHITCRMIGDGWLESSRLFVDDKDRERFLENLSDRVNQFNIRLYQYVLMTNHFHLVIETPKANCSEFMQSLSTAYTVYYNLRHRRHGHLLDGRYKAKLVEGDDYLLSLTRYVHLNPVHVGLMEKKPIEEKIRHLREYRWSSYLGYIGKGKKEEYLEYGPILAMMGGKKKVWAKEYQKFVESGLAKDDEEFKKTLKLSPRSIGGSGFRAWVDVLYQKLLDDHDAPEDVSFRRITEPLKVEDIMNVLAEEFGVKEEMFRQRKRGSAMRAVAARMLMTYGAQTQRQAAEHLSMGTGGAVSAQVRRLPVLLTEDSRLERMVKKIESLLEEKRSAKRR
jgi:REP element-mobilizing transposase RayT